MAILTYHVLPGKITAASLTGKRTAAKTVQGGSLHIDGRDGVKVNAAHVTTADVQASNGVVHIIDKVLLPK